MNYRSVNDYAKAHCNFRRESPIPFAFVHEKTNGRVCDTGCGEYNGGQCSAYRKLLTNVKPEIGQEPGETVRQMAERLGITIAEVRRRRRQGENK
jgi:hypothetical protein